MLDHDILARAKALSPDNCYLGGSKAIEHRYGIDLESEDYDFFYYIDRPCETRVMDAMVASVFPNIITRGEQYTGKYLIPGQYKYYSVWADTWGGTKVDLIFISPKMAGDLMQCIGSTLAGVQYKLKYDIAPSGVVLPKPKEDMWLHPAYLSEVNRMDKHKACIIYEHKNTDSQVQKVKKRCNLLGYEYRFYTAKPRLQDIEFTALAD